MDSIQSIDENSPLLPEPRPTRTKKKREVTRQARADRNVSVSGTETDGERGRTFSESELDIPGWEGSCFCHPQALLHRIIGLTLMCLLGFGSYFCYDNPGALQSELKTSLNITTAQFSNLYS